MSSKLVKKLLLQTSTLEQATPPILSKKEKRVKEQQHKDASSSVGSNRQNRNDNEIMDSQVQSMLIYDRAFSRRSGTIQGALKRKLQNEKRAEMQRKKLKMLEVCGGGTLTNSRSSSSRSSLLEIEPTFNKKKAVKEKKKKSLRDLAKMLKHNKK